MCRWLAYFGNPILIEELLYKPHHSLIDQSLHSRMGYETTNGDGFGLGWYGTDGDGSPAVFRSVEPAWNDRNLHEIAAHVRSRLVFAHVRAATATAIQQTNCHPFRHDEWLFMHNGSIAELEKVKRDLVVEIDASLFSSIEGSTDSEIMFYLALTFGLMDDPPAAIARMVGHVEKTGKAHGIANPIQMTIATTNGEKLWSFRYSSDGKARSLFYSSDVDALRKLYPNNEMLREADNDTRLVVSEPLNDLPGAWNAMPEASWGVVQGSRDELHAFAPR